MSEKSCAYASKRKKVEGVIAECLMALEQKEPALGPMKTIL